MTNPFNAMQESPSGRINAWNGLAANRDTSRLYLAAAGGHADWAGNEVYEIDLSLDTPSWRILRGPSPGNTITFGANYCTDGRPASTHLYYALTFVRSQHRIFKLSAGSVWGSGNESNSNVDGFDLNTGDWDAMGTWDAGSPHGDAIDRPYAHDPLTDDAYTFFSGAFRKWTSSVGTWTSLAARPSYANNDIVHASPAAVDTQRGRVLFTRNAYKVAMNQGLLLTNTGTLTDVTFTGADVAAVTARQGGMHYLAAEDTFLLKTDTSGEMYRIDATTFAVTTQPTTGPKPPDAVNGVYTRFQYLPLLGGYAYLPSSASNFWFLATQ